MKKLLIFDLDGTLLDSLEDLKNSTNYALKKFGYPERSLDEVRRFVGNGLRLLMVRALPKDASEDTVIRALGVMKAHYKEHCHDKTVPYAGIISLLENLKNRGYHTAVVSNKAQPMVDILKDVYFRNLIDIAVGESDKCARKPEPDMVNTVRQKFSEEPVFIGDSDVDIKTAENAGIPCLSVAWGFRTVEQLKSAGAEKICKTPEELLQVILKL